MLEANFGNKPLSYLLVHKKKYEPANMITPSCHFMYYQIVCPHLYLKRTLKVKETSKNNKMYHLCELIFEVFIWWSRELC